MSRKINDWYTDDNITLIREFTNDKLTIDYNVIYNFETKEFEALGGLSIDTTKSYLEGLVKSFERVLNNLFMFEEHIGKPAILFNSNDIIKFFKINRIKRTQVRYMYINAIKNFLFFCNDKKKYTQEYSHCLYNSIEEQEKFYFLSMNLSSYIKEQTEWDYYRNIEELIDDIDKYISVTDNYVYATIPILAWYGFSHKQIGNLLIENISFTRDKVIININPVYPYGHYVVDGQLVIENAFIRNLFAHAIDQLSAAVECEKAGTSYLMNVNFYGDKYLQKNTVKRYTNKPISKQSITSRLDAIEQTIHSDKMSLSHLSWNGLCCGIYYGILDKDIFSTNHISEIDYNSFKKYIQKQDNSK